MAHPSFEAGAALRQRLMARGALSAIADGAGRVATLPVRLLGKLLASPIRSSKETALDLALGSKARFGPMKGQRLHPASTRGPDRGLMPINRQEYLSIMSGTTPGAASKVRVGGKTLYMKRRYRRGGLAGFAQEHPLLTAGGGLLGYQALVNPTVRALGSGVAQSARPNVDLDPSVIAAYTDRAAAHPFQAGGWN